MQLKPEYYLDASGNGVVWHVKDAKIKPKVYCEARDQNFLHLGYTRYYISSFKNDIYLPYDIAQLFLNQRIENE